ncbi:TolC family protein [Sphingobacterium sp. Mn56C]|uniref:TolC family protein n=1 Tax=Sphingobacterium sp. Mn56C TaxID=3395261 RepID=UPI003BD997B1
MILKNVNRTILTALVVSIASVAHAQQYSRQDLEDQFLKNNYQLLAGKFNISKADALIVQERLWSNPNLSIAEVNLWSNRTAESFPALFGGNRGTHQQIAFELEQLIETAGKRKKRVAIKGLEKNTAVFEYEELLRELKKDLRQTFNNLARIKEEGLRLDSMLDLFEKLNEQYERQAEKQNIAKADFLRVQTELMGLLKEKADLEAERQDELTQLRILTQLPSLDFNSLVFPKSDSNKSLALPANLMDIALTQNIGLKKQANEVEMANKQLLLEKAQRTPDLTVQMSYDRGGNIMQDFVGLGLSMDLPVFNRNKGNIKAAQFGVDQEKTLQASIQMELENTVLKLRNQLLQYEKTLTRWNKQQSEEQQLILENYRKHLQSNQVTLLQFIDFTQAFREAQVAYLQVMENYLNTYEELQYIVGRDF